MRAEQARAEQLRAEQEEQARARVEQAQNARAQAYEAAEHPDQPPSPRTGEYGANTSSDLPAEAEAARARARTGRRAAEFNARRRTDEARAEERRRAFERDAYARRSTRTRGYSGAADHAASYRHVDEAALLPVDGNLVETMPTAALAAYTLRHQGCPHRCLGVAPNAKVATVRKRYLALARRLHPDKTDEPSATQAFEAIESAFRAMQQ